MSYTPGDQWVATVQLAAGAVYEYKYVMVNYETKEALEWQSGSNAVLAVVVDEDEVAVFDNWWVRGGGRVATVGGAAVHARVCATEEHACSVWWGDLAHACPPAPPCRGNSPGAMVRTNDEGTTRENKLQKWAG